MSFVPANSTSIYQLLDRKLFGIVKSKLRSFAKSNIYSGKERFRIITEHLTRTWKETAKSDTALKPAWNISGLQQRIDLLSGPPAFYEEYQNNNKDDIDILIHNYFLNEEEDNEVNEYLYE